MISMMIKTTPCQREPNKAGCKRTLVAKLERRKLRDAPKLPHGDLDARPGAPVHGDPLHPANALLHGAVVCKYVPF